MAEKQRLHKVLAWAGIASRRKSEALIASGQVSVNKKVVTKLGTLVDPENDEIEIMAEGRILSVQTKKTPRKAYYLLNKPEGYITTVKDTHKRRTVLDLIPNKQERVFPVGRLDKDTTGLLILTNDGELTYQLTHPKFGIVKTYEALIKATPVKENIDLLETGIKLDGKLTAPAEIDSVQPVGKGLSLVIIKIHEGRKRQVKRMFQAIGCPVFKLKRTGYGNLTLDKLKEGQCRDLTPEEVKNLQSLAAAAKV